MDNRSGVVLSVIMVLACMGMGAEALNTAHISRTGCGTSQFCFAEPENCDPAVSGSCFFVSTSSLSGQNISFQLQGPSSGYVAVGLSITNNTGQNDSFYACANINNSISLFSKLNNKGVLTQPDTLPSILLNGSVSGQTISCVFSATVPNATIKNNSTTYISIYNGTVTNGTLGSPLAVFISTAPGNVSNATVSNSLTTSSTTSTTPTPPANISSTGCGTSKFCAAEPKKCDPAVSGSCFFVSTKDDLGWNVFFELQGPSTGYVAVGLSRTIKMGQNDTVYVCANINHTLTWYYTFYNNGSLDSRLPSTLQNGSIINQTISCVFSATVLNATATRSSSTSFYISMYNGTVTNGSLGHPMPVFISTAAVNISNPQANVTNSLTTSTTTSTTPTPFVNVSRTGCGTSKFCAAEPKNCDPSMSGSCFFVSTSVILGQTISFQLQGQSSGYVAVGLSRTNMKGQNDSIYACANINNSISFFSILNNNGVLTRTDTLPSTLLNGSISGQTISCVFSATVPSATRSSSTSFYISIYNGTVTNGFPASLKSVFISTAAVDVSDPTATVTNSLMSTTSNAVGLQSTLSQALLILVCGLIFIML